MKYILIVSDCVKRRNTLGLISGILSKLSHLDKTKYQISLLDTNFFERNHNPADYEVDCYYKLEDCFLDDIIRKIPRIRAKYSVRKAVNAFAELLSEKHFDVVIMYQVPTYADELVRLAHKFETKVVFEPFGSDVLQVACKNRKKMINAFSGVDYVVGRTKSNVLIAAQEMYKVPNKKIKEQREVLSGIIRLKKLRGKLTREEMHKEIGIPYSDYNIVCGYSGRESHRHRSIIDALIKVKDVLPAGYQIVFPMTYGAGQHHEIIINYAKELKAICDEARLNTVFMTDFKTAEQMAYLHLITDLFIEIQPTDNGNAFMIEALYAQNQIVTGRWLGYKRFEQFGDPYYLIDKPEDLADMLRRMFTNQVKKARVPRELVDFFDVPDNYDPSRFWAELFERL